ncbi:hypothetical protein Ancab_014107 [Ancistrocladus abbreviatus]
MPYGTWHPGTGLTPAHVRKATLMAEVTEAVYWRERKQRVGSHEEGDLPPSLKVVETYMQTDGTGLDSNWALKGSGKGISASLEASPRLSATGSASAGPSDLKWPITEGATHSARKTPKGTKKPKAHLKSKTDVAHKKKHTGHSK